VVLLRKETCSLRLPIHLRHSVLMLSLCARCQRRTATWKKTYTFEKSRMQETYSLFYSAKCRRRAAAFKRDLYLWKEPYKRDLCRGAQCQRRGAPLCNKRLIHVSSPHLFYRVLLQKRPVVLTTPLCNKRLIHVPSPHLFCGALLQKRPVVLRSLLIVSRVHRYVETDMYL